MSGDSGKYRSKVREVEAIANGTVIDHIPAHMTLKVATLVGDRTDQVFMGMNLRSRLLGVKGVVKISGRELESRALSCLALIAPTATVSIIRDFTVVSKLAVDVPAHFDGVAHCANPNCITNHERWRTNFAVVSQRPLLVRCRYCERSFAAEELTII